jgi:hypothetical protein
LSIHEHKNDIKRHQIAAMNRKRKYCLALECESIGKQYGEDSCAFMTIGFADPQAQTDPDEAERRFHSLWGNYLSEKFHAAVSVRERGEKNGLIHFHIFGALKFGVKAGFNFDALVNRKGRGTNANPRLRKLWKELRLRLPKFGFASRVQCTPIKANVEAIGNYLGKYMAKAYDCRHEDDKHRRLIRRTRNVQRPATTRFTWVSPFAWVRRERLRRFAFNNGYYELEALRSRLGVRVEYQRREDIAAQRIDRFPSVTTYAAAERATVYNAFKHAKVSVLCDDVVPPYGPFYPSGGLYQPGAGAKGAPESLSAEQIWDSINAAQSAGDVVKPHPLVAILGRAESSCDDEACQVSSNSLFVVPLSSAAPNPLNGTGAAVLSTTDASTSPPRQTQARLPFG